MNYRVDEVSARAIRRTIAAVGEMVRRRGGGGLGEGVSRQGGSAVLVDFGVITAAGADGDHWAWKASLRDATTGRFTEGEYGSAEMGECVVADGGVGYVGMVGLLYWQQGDDESAVIVMVAVGSGVSALLRLDSAATPGGTYNATIRTPPTADIPADTNFEDADLGGDGEEVLVMNLKEQGAATHELVDAANTEDRNCIGLYLYTNSDGVRVFVTDKIWLGCPPDDPISDWV